MTDAFYVPLGDDRYRATVHATGPWDPGAQHGGPPSALLARALEDCDRRDDTMVSRVTVELLGAVPVDEVSVTSRVTRPGRSVELVEASMVAGPREVARASAWRIRRTEASVPSRARRPAPLDEVDVPPPAGSDGWVEGFLQAMDWRGTAGAFRDAGPSTTWTRMRIALVDGEVPSSLTRTMVLADCGNGISAELSPKEWLFINPELTVHQHREGTGEWRCLDAATSASPGGVGLATSVVSDLDGPFAVGAQSLLIARR